MNADQHLGASPDEVEAIVSRFFEQIEPKVRKGRAWTFHRLNAACDTPNGERVQAGKTWSGSSQFSQFS